jgi:hypothetical protein
VTRNTDAGSLASLQERKKPWAKPLVPKRRGICAREACGAEFETPYPGKKFCCYHCNYLENLARKRAQRAGDASERSPVLAPQTPSTGNGGRGPSDDEG